MTEPCCSPPDHPETRLPARAPPVTRPRRSVSTSMTVSKTGSPSDPKQPISCSPWLRRRGAGRLNGHGCRRWEPESPSSAPSRRGPPTPPAPTCRPRRSPRLRAGRGSRPDRSCGPVGGAGSGGATRPARHGRWTRPSAATPMRTRSLPAPRPRPSGSTRRLPSPGRARGRRARVRYCRDNGALEGGPLPRFIHDRSEVQAKVEAAGSATSTPDAATSGSPPGCVGQAIGWNQRATAVATARPRCRAPARRRKASSSRTHGERTRDQ